MQPKKKTAYEKTNWFIALAHTHIWCTRIYMTIMAAATTAATHPPSSYTINKQKKTREFIAWFWLCVCQPIFFRHFLPSILWSLRTISHAFNFCLHYPAFFSLAKFIASIGRGRTMISFCARQYERYEFSFHSAYRLNKLTGLHRVLQYYRLA